MWAAVEDVRGYYGSLYHYLVRGGQYGTCPYFTDRLHPHVYVFSIALSLRMWNDKHYRAPSYQQDLLDNLRNVAVPGTGIPLSVFCRWRLVALFYVLFVAPLVCLASALLNSPSPSQIPTNFRHQLVEPNDWFNYWRLNSRLIAWHSNVTGSSNYDIEDKWTFLRRAKENNVPVTPWNTSDRLCLKHRNIEGGMGIKFFQNVTCGGDWIIQEALTNGTFLESILPDDAPLSTFRLVTAAQQWGDRHFKVYSCVLRAGRAGATTDHKAIFYNVDIKTGIIDVGCTNSHWYKLGGKGFGDISWRNPVTYDTHPDSGQRVAGLRVPDFNKLTDLVTRAHRKMAPYVPLVGWDVAVTREHGPCLLEANLSCNFFCGAIDRNSYFRFMDSCFQQCTDMATDPGQRKKLVPR